MSPMSAARSKRVRVLTLLLLLITWTALQFRLIDVPPGFQHDQMFNSTDALDVLQGRHQLYFPANFGREPLGIYATAGAFALTGGHYVWSFRYAGTVWAILGLAATVSLARRYVPAWAALFAVALMAGSFWFVFAGRLGLEPIALVPLSVAMLYFLDRAGTRRSRRDGVAAGVFGGLAVDTYLASRVLFALPVLLLASAIAHAVFRGRGTSRSLPGDHQPVKHPDHTATEERLPEKGAWSSLFLCLAVMVVVSGPLLGYIATHMSTADQRLGELGGAVSTALTGDLRPILGKAQETVLSVLWAGPAAIPYHYNVPGRPALQPIWSAFFLFGFGLTVARARRRHELLLVLALLLGLTPVFLSGADALYMRGVIALPLLFILVGRGVCETAEFFAQRARTKAVPVIGGVLLAALLGWHWVDGYYAYFITWAQAEPTRRIYNADFRAAADYLRGQPSDQQVWIGTDRQLDIDRKTYLLYEPTQPDAGWFYLPGSPPLPAGGGALYLLPGSPEKLPPALAFLSDAVREHITIPGPGERYTVLSGLRLSRTDVDAALRRSGVQPLERPLIFGEALRLEAAGASDFGDTVELVTRWTALAPWPYHPPPGQPPAPPKLSVSLDDAFGYRWAQVDVASALPYRTWQQGDSLLEIVRLPRPADLPPGPYPLQLVLYDDRAGRLAIRSDGDLIAAAPQVAMVQVASRGDAAAPSPPFLVDQPAGSDRLRMVGKWEPLDNLVVEVPADLHISWQAVAGGLDPQGLRFRLRAFGDDGSILWEQSADPLTPLPVSWPGGQVYRLTHRLHPQMSRSGTVTVRLELCALQGEETLACGIVGRPQMTNRPPLLALATPPKHPSEATWDGQLRLAGYDLAREGDTLALTLYWQVAARPAMALKRFVHAVDGGGQILAQADDVPDNGGIPISWWRPGEYVVDAVRLPASADRQIAQIFVGWYDASTGKRTPVRSGTGELFADDRVPIGLP